ncbi:MAG: lipoprotein NlpI [Methanosaeta sp. PtaB.Bin039]|nr:MAG: lipoprotein NlpI [Methanosaeta sp. PtaB.Bin039]HOT07188.1 tetratricopeptide repeat protein [Methanotrichaceae archaeon]HQF17207.1 tetratricopeptide repeat protein [Methanotrichaceae archaeon]HQI91780.1 tetratricopeptide repeat protein [Methanotrichaceae archaeon]HQJ29019.1 tetratricopeptide repeat protein [Methanotrichaceae archaeon]
MRSILAAFLILWLVCPLALAGNPAEELVKSLQTNPPAPARSVSEDATAERIDWMQQATLQYMNGSLEQALESATRAVQEDPGNQDAWEMKGVLHFSQGQLEDAMKSLDKAVDLNYSDKLAHLKNGVVRMAAGQYEKAVSSFNRAIEIDPDYADAYYRLSYAKAALNDSQAALDALNRSLAINPENAQAWNFKGFILARALQNYAQSLPCFQEAIRLDSSLDQAWTNQGGALLMLNRSAEALDSFVQALRLNPNNAGAWQGKSLAYAALGDEQNAQQAADRARSLGYIKT